MRRVTVALVGLISAALIAGTSAGGAPSPAPTLRPGVVSTALAQKLAASPPDAMVDVVVTLGQRADLSPFRARARAARKRGVVQALRATADSAQRSLLGLLAVRRLEHRVANIEPLWIIDGVGLSATPDVIRELAARPDVSSLQLSTTLQAPASVAAAPGAPEPNVALVHAPELWNLGYRGQGVVVANVDTGVDITHPELAATYRGGTNSWYDPNGEHPSAPLDRNGHGTWTMGVMVAGSAGGTSLGIAPSAKWIAVKLFNDKGVTTTTKIHLAYQWLLDPDANPATADAPDVVDSSWTETSGGCDLQFEPDLNSLRAAGILPVFAAGNAGPAGGTSTSPGNNPEAFAVGSTTVGDVVDSSSSRGPSACDGSVFPRVTAPGVNIKTTDLYGGYASESGTSMAAPHVAGALALLLSAFPDLPVDRQEAALEAGAVDLGSAGPDNVYGHGRLDILGSYNFLDTTPDFTVVASPGTASTLAGGTVSYSVSVASVNGFTGDVSLALSGLTASQASWTFTPATISGAGSAQLDVTASATLAPGSYQLTVSGSSGAATHASVVTLQIAPPPDFTVAASAGTASTQAGSPVSYSVTVGSVSGFTGDVSLSLSGLTAGQGNWTFTPSTIGGGAGTAQLVVTTASTLAPGSYQLTVSGTSGATTHTTTVALQVTPPPDFTVAASPGSATAAPGGTASYTVSVGSLNGFAGTVSLTLSGLTASQASWSLSPSSLIGSGSSALTVTTASSLAAGTYPLTVTATSGALTHTASVSLVISQPPDFTVAASPASATVAPGGTASFTVSVGSLNGFAGTVSLTLSGLTASQASWTLTPSSLAGAGSSTLRVTAASSLAAGTYPLTVTATSGALVRTASVILVVSQPPDFTLTASPSSVSVSRGSSAVYTVSVGQKGGFSGSVTLSATGLPSGSTATFNPNPRSAPGSSTLTVRTSSFAQRRSYTLTITGRSGSLVHQATVTLVVR